MAEASAVASGHPAAHNPPREAPPIYQISITHGSVTQPFSMSATDLVKNSYRQIVLKPKGHYLVEMRPETFMETPKADMHFLLKEEKVRHVSSMCLGHDVQGLVAETQNRFPELAHKSRYRKSGKMFCRRIILDTAARDLSMFTWCKVLLSCIADAVEAAQQAYKIGLLHGDLSASNIMIARDKNTNECGGILVDWDRRLIQKNRGGQARAKRTGTLAFMSAKILHNLPPLRHTLWDDMESAFWVLVYHILRYTKNSASVQLYYMHMQELFATPVSTVSGPEYGGYMKKKGVILSCAIGSSSHLTSFKVIGLNELLDKLGVVFGYRYITKKDVKDVNEDEDEDPDEDDAEDESGDSEDENEEEEESKDKDEDNEDEDEDESYLTNLNDPDMKWFSDSLREVAMAMKPLRITPTGLKSPTNDSRPPADLNNWKPASVSGKNCKADWHLTPWASNPKEFNRVQKDEFGLFTISMINHLDGYPIYNRRHIGDVVDEED